MEICLKNGADPNEVGGLEFGNARSPIVFALFLIEFRSDWKSLMNMTPVLVRAGAHNPREPASGEENFMERYQEEIREGGNILWSKLGRVISDHLSRGRIDTCWSRLDAGCRRKTSFRRLLFMPENLLKGNSQTNKDRAKFLELVLRVFK